MTIELRETEIAALDPKGLPPGRMRVTTFEP